MFSSRHHFNTACDIPSKWIFENYFGLNLSGHRVCIKSVFNPDDKTPSMYIYYSTDTEAYRFKCFSTGKGGSAVELMMHAWSCNFMTASERIITDYIEFLKTGNMVSTEMIDYAKWKVSDFTIRGWTQADATYWSAYNISSNILEHYNVVPLEKYTMSKVTAEGEVEAEFVVTGKNIYGYFNNNLVLYKIYQPFNLKRKFIKVCSHPQGRDQFEGHDILILAASLKDCMAIKSMGLKVDIIAPDSENTYISAEMIAEFKADYKAIVVMMDSDEAGIKSMKYYEEQYKLPFVYLSQEKDISDIVKIHGVKKALYAFYAKLQSAIDKYKRNHEVTQIM